MNQLAPIQAAMQTDQGRVRDHNEDFIARKEPHTTEDEQANGWIYIVADGVGGADAGEFASEYATSQTIATYLENSDQEHYGQRLVKSMQTANTNLRTLVAERYNGKRMATTMVAVVITDGRAYIANVGDSRGYHWRNNELRQVTKDQSLVAKLLEEGAITEEEAANHPHRNVILFSIGSEKKPKIDLFEVSLGVGDKIFLCSDGLTRHVSDDEINAVMDTHDLEQATEQLIQLANDRGGQDNISVAVIDYGRHLEQAQPAEAGAEPRVIMSSTNGQDSKTLNHTFLIPFTVLLSIVEALLIFFAWVILTSKV